MLWGVNYRFRRSVMKIYLSFHHTLEGHTQATRTSGCSDTIHRAFLVWLYHVRQLHRVESLHLPAHPVTSKVLREAIIDILCSYI